MVEQSLPVPGVDPPPDPTQLDSVVDWQGLFELPMAIAIAAALLLAFAFRPPKEPAGDGGATALPH